MLLIVSILDDAALAQGALATGRLGLDALVEAHDAGEVARGGGGRVLWVSIIVICARSGSFSTTPSISRVPPEIFVQ